MLEDSNAPRDSSDTLATRELQSDFGPVVVTMASPRLTDDGNDYVCCYAIRGPRTRKRGHAMGVDAFQALALTMQKIGIDLRYSEEGQAGNLRWFDTPGETGFPLPPGHEA